MTETDKIGMVPTEAEKPSRDTSPSKSETWYKVVLCGSPDVGKTSIYTRIKDKKFETNGNNTSCQECIVDVPVSSAETLKICLVDTLGLERHAALTRPHYKDSHVVLVVYSTEDRKSFDEIPRFVEEARNYEPGVPLFLIRNKIDLEELGESIVSQEQENDKYLHSTDFKVRMRVSAKTGEGIEDISSRLAKFLLNSQKRGTAAHRRARLQLEQSEESSRKSGRAKCC